VEEGEVFGGVFVVEDGGAGDDEVGIHFGDLGNGVFVDATIDTNEELGFPPKEGFDFGGDVVEEEFLSRVGTNTEEEDVVDLVEILFDKAGRGAGVERDAADDVFVGGDAGEGVVDVRGVFDGEGDEIGSGFGEGVDVLLGLVDEEVNVLEEVGLQSGDEGRAHGDVGPDVAVHDVEVKEVDAVFLEGLQGSVLVAHVGTEGGDGELGFAADKVDFFLTGHSGE